MICPKCGAEYQPGFTECVDCRVPLAEPGSLDAAPGPGDEWVVLTEHTFRFGWASLGVMDDAGFRLIALKSELESGGIPVQFDPFAPGEGGGFTDTFYQPIRLLVRSADIPRAVRVLEDFASAPVEIEGLEDEPEDEVESEQS